jgi:hypothetical protein
VPTPFYHLDLAEKLLSHGALEPSLRERLLGSRSAFLFGNTAPDFVTLAGLPREAGHFFDVPIRRSQPAHRRLLEIYPGLSAPSRLPDNQAAFLAGYLAHLWLDQAWIIGVFEPIFGPDVHRDSFQQRLLDHNLLRAHMDRGARRHLPDGLAKDLAGARPHDWLPFADDRALAIWRDHLAEQLLPGGHSRTIDVFAHRHGISPTDFTQQLNSPPVMSEAVFKHLPPELLSKLQKMWLERSIELVNNYLSDGRIGATHVNRPLREQLTPQPMQNGG